MESSVQDLVAATLRLCDLYQPRFEDERQAVDAARELCATAMAESKSTVRLESDAPIEHGTDLLRAWS